MNDQAEVAKLALGRFANRDYEAVCRLVAGLLPQTTLVMIQILLISLQRLGREELIGTFAKEHLPHLAKYPWEGALVNLTLGTVAPGDVKEMATTNERKAELYCYYGSRLLTFDNVETARGELEKCLQVEGSYIEQELARVQMGWPSQQPIATEVRVEISELTHEWGRLRKENRLDEALIVAENARAISAAQSGYQSDLRLRVMNNLSIAHLDLGQLDQAEATCVEALSLLKSGEEPVTTDAAITHNLVAQIQRRGGKLEEAIENLEIAIQIRSSIDGPSSPEVANLLAFLAETHTSQGNLEAATQVFRAAWKHAVDVLGEEADFTGIIRERFADHLFEHGPLDEAESLSRASAEMASRHVAANDPHGAQRSVAPRHHIEPSRKARGSQADLRESGRDSVEGAR